MINDADRGVVVLEAAWDCSVLPHCCLQEAALHLGGCLSQWAGKAKFVSVAHGNSSVLLAGRPVLTRQNTQLLFLGLCSDWLRFRFALGSGIPIILQANELIMVAVEWLTLLHHIREVPGFIFLAKRLTIQTERFVILYSSFRTILV
jgi:hypothetical protein